jgi:hypothetical protein
MASLYLLLYRMYFVLKDSSVGARLRQWKHGGRGLDQLRRLLRHRLWVQVQSGLSRGMWMHLSLPGEGGYWRGTHEPDVQNAISAAVRPGTVVYDIGAHIGSIALGAARLAGNSGRLVAFDGDPENILRLRDNSWRNGLEDRLQIVHAQYGPSLRVTGFRFGAGEQQALMVALRPMEPTRSTSRSSVMRILHHLAGFFPARHQAVQIFMKHALSDRMHMARKGA